MRDIISGWRDDGEALEPPAGRWAIELRDGGGLIGGAALLPLPPHGVDLEIGWQLAPTAWGRGLAAEAGHAVAHYAFESGIDELFAVVRPRNERGVATARRVGMEWVGETEKYSTCGFRCTGCAGASWTCRTCPVRTARPCLARPDPT